MTHAQLGILDAIFVVYIFVDIEAYSSFLTNVLHSNSTSQQALASLMLLPLSLNLRLSLRLRPLFASSFLYHSHKIPFHSQVIIDYQTHYKLRMANGRSVAEYLFDRVKYWSFGQTVLIVFVAATQVYMLRNFFAEKKENI